MYNCPRVTKNSYIQDGEELLVQERICNLHMSV